MYESFIFYSSFHEATKDLSMEQYGKIMYVLNEYALNGTIPESFEDPIVKMAFTFMKPQVDANNARKEAGSKGGRPSNKKPMVSKNSENEKPVVIENDENTKPVVIENSNFEKPNVNENVNVNVNDMVCETANEHEQKTTVSKTKTKKPPLREREPENEIEYVEKAYLYQWDSLYSRQILQTPEPPTGQWNCARALIRQNLDNGITADQLILAINSAASDAFVLQGGYSLKMIMSSGVLNRLVNGHNEIKVGGKALMQNDIDAMNNMNAVLEASKRKMAEITAAVPMYDTVKGDADETSMW